MPENKDQENSEYGHFSRSLRVGGIELVNIFSWTLSKRSFDIFRFFSKILKISTKRTGGFFDTG